MKCLFFLVAGFGSAVAQGATFEEVALERFAHELNSAESFGSKITSLNSYIADLDRIGSVPASKEGCVSAIRIGVLSSSCFPLQVTARSGGGTGGVD